MIKYGAPYLHISFDTNLMHEVRRAISETKLDWKSSKVVNDDKLDVEDKSLRVCESVWIRDYRLNCALMDTIRQINRDADWYLNITDVEPIQFGVYPEGGKYDWHVDQHNNFVPDMQGKPSTRKISMSLFLSNLDEYEGGEFDLEIYKPDSNPRYETFRLKKGDAIFFNSTTWHRVRPVTSGVRKSIVAWFTGPPYA
jgi:PKHD-type hydroxylase